MVVIFGIFMLVLISLFSISEKNEKKEAVSFVEAKIVESFIEQCLSDIAKNTLKSIAVQGGYNELPELSTTQLSMNVPYYFYNRTKYIPTIQQIQKNSAERMVKNIRSCLNFSRFPDVTIVQASEPRIHVLLTPADAEIKLYVPIAIQKETTELIIEQFIVHIPTHLLQMYEYATRIIENQKQPGQYCISCTIIIENRAGFTTESISTPEGTIITLRKDEEYFSLAMR